mgnify:FL=1
MSEKPVIDFEEIGRFNFYLHLKSYTATSFKDAISKSTGKYVLDCCNIEYCKTYRTDSMSPSCLMGSIGERCTFEQKQAIQDEAKSKGFTFQRCEK